MLKCTSNKKAVYVCPTTQDSNSLNIARFLEKFSQYITLQWKIAFSS